MLMAYVAIFVPYLVFSLTQRRYAYDLNGHRCFLLFAEGMLMPYCIFDFFGYAPT